MFLLLLQVLKIIVPSIEASFPKAAIIPYPIGDGLQCSGLQAARPPLGVASARSQTRSFQYLQVF